MTLLIREPATPEQLVHRSILALYTQNQSDRLLEISGLLTNIPLPRS